MKFVVEKNIPFISGLLEDYATVIYPESEEITPQLVADADALLVRTRTRCNQELLGNSAVKFVGTATIGLDHIDRQWCGSAGIEAVNAPGCNAPAVAQYVLASVMQLINRPISQYTIGIVGVGHVGSIVDRWARSMGMNVMLCDPPRALRGDTNPEARWFTLAELAQKADIITFHTPLTRTGEHPSWHLADDAFFKSLQRHPIFINSARGPVVDTQALLKAMDRGNLSHVVIDTWEGEPGNISTELLQRADIATPHIAGYSIEGKIRATRMILDSLCRHFSLPHVEMDIDLPDPVPAAVTPAEIASGYNPLVDTEAFRRAMHHATSPHTVFENLRNYYNLRPEPHTAHED